MTPLKLSADAAGGSKKLSLVQVHIDIVRLQI